MVRMCEEECVINTLMLIFLVLLIMHCAYSGCKPCGNDWSFLGKQYREIIRLDYCSVRLQSINLHEVKGALRSYFWMIISRISRLSNIPFTQAKFMAICWPTNLGNDLIQGKSNSTPNIRIPVHVSHITCLAVKTLSRDIHGIITG